MLKKRKDNNSVIEMTTANILVYSFPLFLCNRDFEIGVDYFVISVFITKVDDAHFQMSVLSRGRL